jgi:hypothetical protein
MAFGRADRHVRRGGSPDDPILVKETRPMKQLVLRLVALAAPIAVFVAAAGPRIK